VGKRVWHKCESGMCPKQLGSYSVVRTSMPGVVELR
jgi:hypothetical protein